MNKINIFFVLLICMSCSSSNISRESVSEYCDWKLNEMEDQDRCIQNLFKDTLVYERKLFKLSKDINGVVYVHDKISSKYFIIPMFEDSGLPTGQNAYYFWNGSNEYIEINEFKDKALDINYTVTYISSNSFLDYYKILSTNEFIKIDQPKEYIEHKKKELIELLNSWVIEIQ